VSAPEKIAVLITGDPVPKVLESRGDFEGIFRELLEGTWEGEVVGYDIREGEFPPLDEELKALIITGSAANVPNQEPWMVVAQEWLRAAVPTGVPTFGVCFGHQLLAQALGGEVQLNPKGREMSTVEVERSGESPIFEGVDERFRANACHVDTVVALPEGAEALATSSGDDHQCIRFSDTCYGVQFHPEFDSEVMRGYVEARSELITAEGLDAEAMLARASDTPMGGQVLRNFVRHFLGSGASEA